MLNYKHLMIAGLVAVVPGNAFAAPASGDPPLSPRDAFAERAVSDEELAASYGGMAGGDRTYRLLAEADSAGFLQQVSRTSRDAMDNWWSQTGAALIDNNIFAQH